MSSLSHIVGQQRWIMGGDFNIILSLEEKKGGIRRLDKESANFQDMIDTLHLIDVETWNGTFTWTNRRSGVHQVAFRLDRFLILESLMLDGPLIEANILPKSGSDHWPVQLWIDTVSTPKFKPFRFENFWLSFPNFQELANTWWEKAEVLHGS
jgi:endonuclease/exonuclease/phosphatase family metal-dependent hydrolase